MYKVEWETFNGTQIERFYETEKEALEQYDWLESDDMISYCYIEKS